MRSSHYRQNFGPEIPLSQLDNVFGRGLTTAEESGSIAREMGLVPQRLHQIHVGYLTTVDQRHVCYAHPPMRSSVPYPSERRAGPRRPEAAA